MTSEVPQVPESDLSASIGDEFMNNFSESENNTQSSSNKAIEAKPLPDVWLDESEADENESQFNNPSADNSALTNDDWLESMIESTYNDESEAELLQEESGTTKSNQIEPESELFTAQWLDESEQASSTQAIQNELQTLQQKKEALTTEIILLKQQKSQILSQQVRDVQEMMGKMVEEGIRELKERKNALQIEIDKLERRRERIRQEMRTNFAGVSQDLAIRVQGFKDYLVGSLQDLAAAAEQLELPKLEAKAPPSQPRETRPEAKQKESTTPNEQPLQPQFTEQAFAQQTRAIRKLLEQYRSRPDYYGPPWQLRRTFEPIHAERVQNWFFTQGGRGAIKTMGSRLQNILIASAVMSVLHQLYRDRCVTLVLVNTPERLGEWRRGLQDCLGISRTDFGTNRGVVIFESPEVLAQRAERLIKDKLLPLIIIDETEDQISLSLLQFPLWLAFAPDPQSQSSSNTYLY
ncbi:hypothetical protein STA3757_23010 [Stanieria sp. NIES-3757]|nr:hypothetical protein STA3757_23010 [Stanieria sp. NIES-3757]